MYLFVNRVLHCCFSYVCYLLIGLSSVPIEGLRWPKRRTLTVGESTKLQGLIL